MRVIKKMKALIKIIPIFFLTIIECTSTGFSKKNININYLSYDIACEPIAESSLNCR